jgi:hypothetical protein
VGAFDESLRFGDFVDWYARALDQELRIHMLPDVLALRRLHTTNMGVTGRDKQRRVNVAVLKRALDRRRARAREPRL